MGRGFMGLAEDLVDQDDDGRVFDNIAGGAAGIVNAAGTAMTGDMGGIGDAYSRGSAAGNRWGDGVASWWDNL